MPKYLFMGNARLRSVTFTVEAETEDQAKKIAMDGKYSDIDYDEAIVDDFDIDAKEVVGQVVPDVAAE